MTSILRQPVNASCCSIAAAGGQTVMDSPTRLLNTHVWGEFSERQNRCMVDRDRLGARSCVMQNSMRTYLR
jgi:hypothetical protein